MASLRRVYAAEFLDDLPQRLGPLLRARMEHAFATHPNRTNPYARALLLGESVEEPPPPEAKSIRTVCADAAGFLEGEPRSSFHGFALSNVLDGADARYERRLLEAVRRAAAPGAVTVLRSFREPRATSPTNRVAEDRSMLWGIVDVRSAGALQGFRAP
jgi:S-adenosylmethionine:diacylglycerol 3-amino-3-carboxypropyl transferase